MREKIVDIIEKHYDDDIKNYHTVFAAEEIAAHVMEFIEWITKQAGRNNIEYIRAGVYVFSHRLYTLDQLYEYWINNVKE